MHHRQDGLDLREVPSALHGLWAAFGGVTIPPSWARSILRLALLMGMTAGLVPVYLLLYPLGRGTRFAIARTWFRGCCRLCSLKLRVIGTPRRDGPTLFAANHVSYLDIPAFGALMDAVFVAKREVKTWPVFGPLARLVRTEFIGRKRREAARQTHSLSKRLKRGESLIVFPEGTSTNGLKVRPFKSSLFGVAEQLPKEVGFKVQPVSIAYPRYATGKALIGGLESLYAWYGDMTMLPHVLTVLGLRGAEVELRFHEPVDIEDFADRKQLARHCESQVAAGVAASNGSWRTAVRSFASPAIAAGDMLDLLDDEPEFAGDGFGAGLLEDAEQRPVVP
ncbi:MAG: 1-acyl-sn-glycerol-3-phosphate acyltransferase [Rhodospirillales bacterium]|nr:1-acyl-sn-glycerol-3-phosphate acyltransferase [Rhodospirillales bacterium]